MESSQAARLFHDWAETEGLMPDGPGAPVADELAGIDQIRPVTEQGKLILRARQVQSIGFNEATHEIVVFTKKAAPSTKKLLASIPASVDDVAITYRQGVQTPIGGTPSVPFGAPPFVVRNSPAG